MRRQHPYESISAGSNFALIWRYQLTESVTKKSFGIGTKLSYGFGSVAYGVKDNGFGALLLLFYNQALGLDARLAGFAIAIALVVDAFIDPLIGYASDRFQSSWGRRHPFMYAAAIPAALSYAFLFSPPVGLSQTELFVYLLVGAILVRVFIAIFEIPNASLISEFTQNYDERTSYLNWRLFFSWMSGLTMSVLAFGIFLSKGQGPIPGTQVVENYKAYGIAAGSIMLLAMLTSSAGTHHTIPSLKALSLQNRSDISTGFFKNLRESLSSRSAQINLAIGMSIMLSMGLLGGITPYVYGYLFVLSPQEISILYGSGFLSAFFALIFTPYIARYWEKRQAFIVITVAALVITPIAALLQLSGVLPKSESVWLIPILFSLSAIGSTFLIVQSTLYFSMSADVIEENEVRTGRRNEGVFFAANIFVRKCATGLGVLLTSTLITLVGFPEKAIPGTVPESVINQLVQFFIISFLILNLVSIACVLAFKITRSRHAENLAIIESRRNEIE